MKRIVATLLLVGLACVLPACNVAKPAPQNYHTVSTVVAAPPSQVLEWIRGDAMANGAQIAGESANSIQVDFGVAPRTIPVPTDYGLWGTPTSFRETEVFSSAVFHVSPTNGGSLVTMFNNPIYWHPEHRLWLPGPYDTVPGTELLRRMSN